MSQSNQTLLIYRIIGNQRVPYHLELDATMTVIADRPVSMTPAVVQTDSSIGFERVANIPAAIGASLSAAEIDRRNQEMMDEIVKKQQQRKLEFEDAMKRGINNANAVINSPGFPEVLPPTMEELPQAPGKGRSVLYRPTALDIRVGEWVTGLIKENPIPGTDELREQFFAEEEKLKARHEADGTVCKPCETGALIRKYRDILKEQGLLAAV